MGKKTKLWQRWLSLVLAIYMGLSNVPLDALAQETEKPAAQTEAAGQWEDVDTDALYNTIPVAPGQLVGDTGEIVENEIYGYVVNYPLKKGHILSISDSNYVFSVRKLADGNYSTMLKQATVDSFTATEDMTIGCLIRKPDKSAVTAEELAGVVLYDSQFGMINVEGTVHRFTVEAETIDGGTATTRAAIFLPDSYSESGTPTRLIVMTNGYSAHLTDSVWNQNTADNVGIIRNYLKAGYAVYVVDNTAGRTSQTPDLGCPQLVSSYRKAYEYIQQHFNVEQKMSIHSRSFGTFAAMRLMREIPELIKCAVMTGARVSIQKQWPGLDKTHIANRFGFADTTGNTYEADKMVGYDPYTDVDGDSYALPPTYWVLCQGDATAEPLTVVEKLTAHGNEVASIIHTGTDHTGVCTLNTEAMFSDALAFLNAHQEESLAGKTLSILGASISTFDGTSNGAAADTTNSTIRNNVKYYPNTTIPEVTLGDTWWMQAAEDLGLRLLVNNAWSGSSLLYERNGTVGAYVDRCVQLHDDTGDNAGEMPDIIGIQMGTNDFQYYKDTLGTADIDYDALIKANGDGTYTYAAPVTSLEAAAIVLHKISVRYPDAEVYYLNISQRVDNTDELIRSFNADLRQVVEHFGAHIVDIYGSAITMDSFDTYIGDGRVHPNCLGMDAYTEAFKKALLANTGYCVTTHTVSLELDGVTADYGDDKIVVSGDAFTVNLTAGDSLEVKVTMGGADITEAVYADGTVTIPAVTADVVITAKSVYAPKSYRWEFDGTDLAGENTLTKTSGTTTDGVFSKTSYSLKEAVVLNHDQPWVVEWKSEGTFLNANGSSGARVFTSDNVNANYNARYIFKSNTDGLIAMGEKTTTGSHNYGIALADHGIDWTAEHTYRLENRIAADGSNMVWLYVDGEEIGPMVHYHVGTTDKNTTSDWLSGKDFRFPYMGTDTHGFTNASIDYIQVWEGGLTHAVPESQGVQNAIARAYALTDVEWTPKKDVPGVQKIDGAYTVVPFKAGVTYKGIPYSGVIATDTYVGLNVSLESFLTALENENSVLYAENLYSTNPKSATYFGTVCSKFAQYVLDVPGSFNTNNVANIPGMETVAMPGEYTLEQVKLGDVILDVVYHTAVCTDLLYDAQGNVAYIEISEAVMPVVRRKLWTPEEFYAEFADYRLCRYAYLDSVPAVPSSQVRDSYALMPRLGDKYNYPVSTTKGVVDVLESGYSTAVILRDGAVAEEIALNGAASFSFDRTVPGKLEMYLVKADGSRSGSVYANVVESSVVVTNAESYANGKLTVSFSGSSGTPLYVQVGSGQSVFCSIEGKQDSAELSFVPARVSSQKVRVAYQNAYGIYLSAWVGFTADANPSDDPLLSQGQYWDGQNITPGSHIPAVQEGKEGHWTYTMVPVEPGTTYYSQGATRLWYLDEKGQPISTYNAYKDSEVPFQFTTPENAAYVSIAYSPKLVEKGTESLKNVSQEESLAGNTIALGDFAVAGVGTGALTTSATQLSQRTLIAVPYPGAQLSIFVKDGYQACVYSGNNNNKIDRNSGWLGTDGDHTSIYTYTLPADAIYMRVSLRKMDGSAMAAEDITHSGLAVAYECGSDVVEDNADVAEILENTELPVLLHISDIHGDVIRAGRAAQFADAVGADALLASGDLTAYEPDDWGHALFDAVGNYPNVNFIYGIGNHDAKISASAYRETIYHSYFRENPDTPNGETYYYRDLAGQKLRIISVNQQEGASTTTSGGTCYSQTQVDWLVETLKSTPAGYGVVLMYHSPETTIAGAESSEYSEFFQVGNRYDNPTNSYSGYSGTFLMDLVDAFMLRKNFVWNYSEKNGTSPVTLSADFTQVAEGVEFIAHITGHVHSDSITYLPGTACKQLLLGVTCTTSMYGADGGYYGLADYSDLKREAHNANQDAFNAYVIDRTNKTVRVLRVGARKTVSDGIRDDMTIPYSIPFTEGEYPFDTEGLVKLDLSNVEWVNYGFQPDGVEPTYYPGLRYSTNAIFDVPYEGVTFYVKINAPFEMGIRSGATDTTMNTNHYWLTNKNVVAGTNNRGYTCTIPAGHKKFILSIANVVRDTAVLTQNYMNELELELAGVEIWYEPIAQTMTLRYDDHYDISGKEVEIMDAGEAVVAIEGGYLVATGIGTAMVKIDGTLYEVSVEKAKVNLVMVVGQSNSGNHFPNATSAVTCPIGTAYYWNYGATEPEDYTQPSMGFHAPLLAELYAQSAAAGDPVKNVLIWAEGYTSKNGQSITAWAVEQNGVINTEGTDGAAQMMRDCLAYYEGRSDKYEIINKVVFCNHGTTDHKMDPQRYTKLFTAMWERLKAEGMEYLAFLRVRGAHALNTTENVDVYYYGIPSAQLEMVRSREDMFMASTLAEGWTGPASTSHSIDVRKYITVMETYGQSATYSDSYGNKASFADGVLTTTMKELYGSNNKVHYGIFGYGLIGADAAYNMYHALRADDFTVVQGDTAGFVQTQTVSASGTTRTIDITGMTDDLIFYPGCGSAAGTMEIRVMSGEKNVTDDMGLLHTTGDHYGAVDVEMLKQYEDVAIVAQYTTANGTGGSVTYQIERNAISLRYDDHYDISGKTVEIVDAGKPTSYQVGYGVEENAVPDTAVVTLEGDHLVATGIGTAQVRIDGQLYEITVEAAPISLLLLAGQSNMRGSEGNAAQSIVCPDGMVYATYGDDRGADNTAMTAANAAQFAPSALTGAYSGINVTGTTDCLSGYPVYSLTEAGAGKIGPDSGFAYEWVKSTGEKVWIVNAAHGGTSINVWQPGKTEYEECQALFTACTETLRKEIAAGHFTLSHMAYFWCQGCSDRTQSAQWYVEKYLAMHEGFKTELAFDHDSNAATADKTFEFGGIIPVRVGSTAACYRDGVSPYTNSYAYHESFVDLRFSGPRVAQYWMINNPELPDIWGVCDIGKDWVWMPDGTNGVADYFQSHYENGTVDYTTQVAQSASWYTPTTPKAVHDSIHYNQIGYNEIGRESVRNALILLGETEAPQVEATVELMSWDGITPAEEIKAWTSGCSDSLVVPVVSPIWKAKEMTYTLTDGLRWEYYDLLADTAQTEGTLTAGTGETVAVVKQEPGAYFADHLSQLPEKLCQGVNLWNILENDPMFYYSGTHWGTHSSGNVYSVTIPVKPGDKIFATAFGKAGENGHATTSGIRCTFFGEYAVVKTLDPGGTYAEFSKNGGYLVVPEGAVAMNIPMWTGDDTNELYILNLPHDRTEGICGICGKDSHIHSWGDWEITQAPTAEALGVEQRKCACGETESREVEGAWQKYDLADHMQEMPESYCAGTNLWAVLEHDVMYFASGTGWGKYSGGGVCSVTIPVQPGDKIYATAFGKAGENGHASSSGIRCTFFDAYGVCKTMNPAGTYAEFSANGGYLVAPEGAVAFNVPMWSGSDENELYILNAPHSYGYAVEQEPTADTEGVLKGICTGCGAETTVTLPVLSEDAYDYAVTKEPTGAETGLATYTWKETAYGTYTFEVVLEKLPILYGDVNGDGTVNNKDRLVLTRYLAKWTDYPEEIINMAAADVNGDGKVNNLDRLILTRHLAKWTGYETLPYKQ